MKKLVYLLICLFLLSAGFAACTNETDDPPEQPSSHQNETPIDSASVEKDTTEVDSTEVPTDTIIVEDDTTEVFFEVDGIYYKKTSKGEVSVIRGDKQYSGDVVIPASITVDGVQYAVTAIGQKAFEFCDKLTSIVIPEGVTSIGNEAFVTCPFLATVEFPVSLREIGQDAFYASSRLRSVQLPEGLERIGSGVFHYSGMEEIVIPSTVSKIDGGFISGAPQISEELQAVEVTSIRVADGNPYYFSTENHTEIIETATGRLVQGTNKTLIPEEVTAIGPYAFFGCKNMTSLTLSKSFKNLEDWALLGIQGLATLYCYPDEPPVISRLSFGGTANDERKLRKACTLYIPKGCKDAYVDAGWTGFKEYVEFDPNNMGDQ